MEVLEVSTITEKEVCLAMTHKAEFDAFSKTIQENINDTEYYTAENRNDEDCSLENVLKNIKKNCTLSLPNLTKSLICHQPAPLWEVKQMLELQQQLPELAAFELHKKIGSGTFSIVYMASLKANPLRLFALKHLVPTAVPHRIEHELKCLQVIGGQDNVVGVDICLRKNRCIVFVMPYIHQSKFHDFVKDIGVAETRDYMQGLLVALKRVHSFNIIHRDVKPSNFLYDRKKKKYLLIDFGLATEGYLPPDEIKPALENKNKRKYDDDLYHQGSSNFANPPKRMALQTIENENGLRSPVLLTHSNQKPNQTENCPPTDTGKVDIRVNEVKKRLFANDSNMSNTCLGQSNMPWSHKSPILRPKKMNRNHPTMFNLLKRIGRENLGTPGKKGELIGKEVYGPQVNDEAVANNHGEFVAPKKNSDWARKSMTPEECGSVLQTTKARKMLMPYKNSHLNVRKPNYIGNRFRGNEKLSLRESNLLPSRNIGKLMASKGNEALVSPTKNTIEHSNSHRLLIEPKQHSTLMGPKGMVNAGGSNIPLENRTIMSTPKESEYLKVKGNGQNINMSKIKTPLMAPKENLPCHNKKLCQNKESTLSQTPRVSGLQQFQTRQHINPSKVKTPLMAPKENLPCHNKKLGQNEESTMSQTPRVSGLQQFQTLTSCEKGGTSLRVQDSQVKEVRKETFVPPPNLTTARCSCFGKGRVCDICLKRKPMFASRAGTPGFRPPEVLLKYSNQTTAVDIWAAGVMMLSLVSSCYPFFRSPTDIAALTEITTLFGSKKFQEVAKKLDRRVTVSQVKKPLNLRKLCEALRRRTSSPRPAEGAETCFDCRQVIDQIQGCICETDDDSTDNSNPSPQEPSDNLFPPSAYDLLNRLLDLNPQTRITAAEALEHPFLKGE